MVCPGWEAAEDNKEPMGQLKVAVDNLLESMAASVPIVATSVGGVPEIVTHRESALLAAPGDPDELAGAISELLTNPALAASLAQRARLLVEMRHSPDSRTRALCALYEEALRPG